MRTAALALGLLAPAAILAAQATPGPKATLRSILTEISRGGFSNETDAFDRLVAFRAAFYPKRPDLLPQIDEGFIKILEQENRQSRAENNLYWKELQAAGPGNLGSAKRVTSPDEGAFLGNAIWAVASLHDPRAIPVLLEDIETGAGAQDAIAAWGDRVVAPLLALQRSASIGDTVCVPTPPDACLASLHASALLAMTRMAAPVIFRALSPAHQARIRETIVRAVRSVPLDTKYPGAAASERGAGLQGAGLLGDRSLEPLLLRTARKAANAGARQTAVAALGELRDPALRPALQAIAASDPDPVVRGTAQIALKKLGAGQ